MIFTLLASILVTSHCHHRSVRLTAIFGSLLSALASLFASFATQLHQFNISLVLFCFGIVCINETSDIIFGKYFKRRRPQLEIFLHFSHGIGLLVMTIFLQTSLKSLKVRLTLQITSIIFVVIALLCLLYRSASLYHPQRRAILHLKTQRRKIREKMPRKPKKKFFDLAILKNENLRCLLVTFGLTGFGLLLPFYDLKKWPQFDFNKIATRNILLGTGIGIGALILVICSLLNMKLMKLSYQKFCQIYLVLTGIFLACIDFLDHQKFTWLLFINGALFGAINYALKTVIFDFIRMKNFNRAWSWLKLSQAFTISMSLILNYMTLENPLARKSLYLLAALSFFVAAINLQRLTTSVKIHSKSQSLRSDKIDSIMPTVNQNTPISDDIFTIISQCIECGLYFDLMFNRYQQIISVNKRDDFDRHHPNFNDDERDEENDELADLRHDCNNRDDEPDLLINDDLICDIQSESEEE